MPPLPRPRLALLLAVGLASTCGQLRAEFRAGAAVVDLTPPNLPVLINGGMLSRSADRVKTRVNARALVLDDGKLALAIVVADSCMLPRPLLDEAKALAAQRTGIPADRMLISATHTHTAPSAMGCLGTEPDEAYLPFLREKLAAAIAAAHAARRLAQIGFARIDAAPYTALRRWIRRPDRLGEDPFGNPTLRANMHAARVWDDVTGESGPKDPDLAVISVQSRDGRPLAVLANFSMHYFGDRDISADYFGLFCEGLKQRLAPEGDFVGIMSHGCSGDIYRVDYRIPEKERPQPTIESYASALVDLAVRACAGITYRSDPDLAMAEHRLTLKYRVPDKQRLEWARRMVAEMGGRLPKNATEVYAREQILLHERQQTEIVVQALRLGDIAIATTPCETYAITGLKLKAGSPLARTMVIELANGGDGYIPPPEQHLFGGYNTWPARSAGLEVTAEPKITQTALMLLEQVTGQPRRTAPLSVGPASRALLAARPASWWRLNEFAGPLATDASGHHRDAAFEAHVAYYLEGPLSAAFCIGGEVNRAPHFVGGRLRTRMADLVGQYTISLWLWNGMPNEGRAFCGWFYSRDHDHGLSAYGEHLGVGGKSGHTGRLVFQAGRQGPTVAGKTEIPRWTWHHAALVRDGTRVRLYLDGVLEAEAMAPTVGIADLMFGGRSDNDSNWEGRLDEIAVFPRALSAAEVARLAAPSP
ncbi:MAG: LamG domain-containing protein [Verrucomicrobia bacterium]|nr:LamG domain-containing protein [Verrucomicrobiota bacterium]